MFRGCGFKQSTVSWGATFGNNMTKPKSHHPVVRTTTVVEETESEPKTGGTCSTCHKVGHRKGGPNCELGKLIETEAIDPTTGEVYAPCACWHVECGGCGKKDKHRGKFLCKNPKCPEKGKQVVGRGGVLEVSRLFLRKW